MRVQKARYSVSRKLIGVTILALSAPSLAMSEQYLKLISGKKYLGHSSSADKKKFIFCDAKVATIPDDAQLEDTLEKCGEVWTLNLARERLLTISEGAAAAKNTALAKDALNTAVAIQEEKEMPEVQIKSKLDGIESKAGHNLKDYLDKGSSALWTTKTNRP